ncbi:hypothetical protein B7982_05125 [Fibrobacter sp. UWB2]|jgi:hypothetical protein|uniref:hypothetical protein n=1 Tax=Fibrobacter sp. UWB2 TaxID=1964358 RepID=UPI000B528AAD|nr:hypothetical protein [Fibrobacter sp. UWB2]OWV23813.1 hypothetical protein B7982_05125 [Fibrobacter sp. UWB2]
MKKKLSICAAAFIALAMTGCDNGKTGTIEGEVRDAFTNKPLEMPTVGMDSTIYTTLSKKYEFNQELRKGKFKFVKVPVGAYRVYAGRSKYVKTRMKIETTEQNPNASLILYIYSAQVDPGLYQGTPEGPLKIDNKWVVYSTNCDESIAGYRLTMPQQQAGDAKTSLAEKIGVKKKGKKGKKAKKAAAPAAVASAVTNLPDPRVVDGKLEVFYHNSSSVSTAITAKTYPAVVAPIASHKDCKGFGAGETKGVFPVKDKATDLKVEYVAENLFKITGNLPKGKQIIQLSQDGKTLQTYYFEAK